MYELAQPFYPTIFVPYVAFGKVFKSFMSGVCVLFTYVATYDFSCTTIVCDANLNSFFKDSTVVFIGLTVARFKARALYIYSELDRMGIVQIFESTIAPGIMQGLMNIQLRSMASWYVNACFLPDSYAKHLIDLYCPHKYVAFMFPMTVGVGSILMSMADYWVLVYLTCHVIFSIVASHIEITKDENRVDFPYYASFLSTMSEKELNSYDDFLNLFWYAVFFFGWFIFVYGVASRVIFNETVLFFLGLPLLGYVLIGVPAFLITDLSFIFVNFLRGNGTSTSFITEFMFDYVAIFAFILRTFVQNVRFLLVMGASYTTAEYGFQFDIKPWINELIDQEYWSCVRSGYESWHLTYSMIFCTTLKLIQWTYELTHLFFLAIVQLSSFLVMVFWLFSFLYTVFTAMVFEDFHEKYRKLRYLRSEYNERHNKDGYFFWI